MTDQAGAATMTRRARSAGSLRRSPLLGEPSVGESPLTKGSAPASRSPRAAAVRRCGRVAGRAGRAGADEPSAAAASGIAPVGRGDAGAARGSVRPAVRRKPDASGSPARRVAEGPLIALADPAVGQRRRDAAGALPSARVAARAPVTPGAVRLTRRGRAVVLMTLSALLLGAFCFGRATGSAAPPRGPQRAVVVHAGDTLWSIARRAAPGSDPRAEVARIAAANHLSTSDLRVGQRLVLPQP